MSRRICSLELVCLLILLVLVPSSVDATSRTHYHDFVVKSTTTNLLSEKNSILTVNGQFPGPTLKAYKSDTLLVNVHNQAQHNITIHWHGVRQMRNPWSDGAAYITQCPIQPRKNFTYTVALSDEEGTFWWHAHDHAARATVHGAIVIFPRPGMTYPFPKPQEEVPIILGEWWKMDVLEIYKEAEETGGDPMHSDAYTINGLPGYLYSSKPEETFKMQVEQDKTYLLRIINAAMEEQLFFTVAAHKLILVSTDGSYTEPLTTDYIMISPGQTMDLLIHANQPRNTYSIAASPFDNGMSMNDTYRNPTTGLFQYINCSSSSPISASLPSYNDSHSANNFTSRIRSLHKKVHNHVDEHMFVVLSMNMMDSMNMMEMQMMSMRQLASMNNISFVEPKHNILDAYYHNISGVFEEDFPSKPTRRFNYTGVGPMDEGWVPEMATKAKVVEFGTNVEIVFQSTNVMGRESHPMHFHGYSFFVVGWGFGNFDSVKDPKKYNLVNPPKQSTVAVPKGGWVAIRFKADNPGVWLLHCHFQHHHLKGMAMVFVVKDGPRLHSRLRRAPQNLPAC